jgi:hypothetical protein
MPQLTDPTPNAAQLTAELRALHERREREPLPPADEARYSELWAWWQASAEFAAMPDVPEEWLAAFDGAAAAAAPSEPLSANDFEQDLVSEWEAWQAKQSPGDPFDLFSDEPGGSDAAAYEDVMNARAEALGSDALAGELAEEPQLEPDAAALSDARAGAPPAPELAPAASPAAPARAVALPGSRRVVIHLTDGQARRGQVADVELAGDTFDYIAAGGAIESVPRSDVRTAFFMRAPGTPAPPAEGTLLRVTLRDGRELAGRSTDHESGGDGFTLVPEETPSSAALVWVSRAAVRSVTARD